MQKTIVINKIISGGQSGVDRSALDFSIKYNIDHGGFCPLNRWAEDGRIPDTYKLIETSEKSTEYRTLKNVISSDGTLIIIEKTKDKGTLKTIEFCKKQNKPLIEFDLLKETDKDSLKKWLQNKQMKLPAASSGVS